MGEKAVSSGGFQYPIVFLPCHDLRVVRSFYGDALRLPVALDQGKCLIFRIGIKGSAGYFGFRKGFKSELVDPEKVCLTLVVSTRSDVDQWHESLTKLGENCVRAPSYQPQFHIYNAFFRDPIGYTLEIQAFDEEYSPK